MGRRDQCSYAGIPASVLGIDHSSCSLSPFLLRVNHFVPSPSKVPTPGNPLLRWVVVPLFSPPCRFLYPCPTVRRYFLLHPGRADQPSAPTGPLTRAPSSSQAACLNNDNSGQPSGCCRRDFSCLRSPLGTAESRGLQRSCPAQVLVTTSAEKTKSKTNTQQMKPMRPHGSTVHPSRGPGWPPVDQRLGSQAEGPRGIRAGGGTSEEFASNIPGSSASF